MPTWYWLVVAFGVGVIVGSRARDPYFRLPSTPPTSPAELDQRVRDLILNGQQLQAIKLYREYHHIDLKGAKEAIDAVALTLQAS